MKLPYRKSAVVPNKKLINYLLSLTHLVGKSKAIFFRGIGFNTANINELEEGLYKIAQKNVVNDYAPSSNNSGINYEIIGTLNAPNGILYQIKTIWFIKTGTKYARFITAYPV